MLLLQLFYILFVLCILSQLRLISSLLNHLRSVTREIRKERQRNFQQFIGRLPND